MKGSVWAIVEQKDGSGRLKEPNMQARGDEAEPEELAGESHVAANDGTIS